MKLHRYIAAAFIVGGFAFPTIKASVHIAQQPDIKLLAPDLAFGKVISKTVSTVEIVVVNQGKAKSPATEGVFNCLPVELENGIGIGFSGPLAIKPLAPGGSFRLTMNCVSGKKITGASLDSPNKAKESNEKNNGIAF